MCYLGGTVFYKNREIPSALHSNIANKLRVRKLWFFEATVGYTVNFRSLPLGLCNFVMGSTRALAYKRQFKV